MRATTSFFSTYRLDPWPELAVSVQARCTTCKGLHATTLSSLRGEMCPKCASPLLTQKMVNKVVDSDGQRQDVPVWKFVLLADSNTFHEVADAFWRE